MIDFVIIETELEQIAEFGSELIQFSVKLDLLKISGDNTKLYGEAEAGIELDWIEQVSMSNWKTM